MGKPSILYCDYGTTATVTGSLTGNGAASDVLIATEDTFYAPLATTSFNFVIDLGAADTFDTIAILGAYLDGVTVEVRASTDNFAASDVSISAAAAITANINTAWRSFTESTYRYWKVLFSGHPSNLRVAHICFMDRPTMPYFETDPDIENLQPEADHLISQAGIYLGSNQQRTMRNMDMEWGQVTPSELVPIQAFADACIKEVNPFFFVPDVDETDVFFGWLDDGGSFAAPEDVGIHEIPTLSFITRAV